VDGDNPVATMGALIIILLVAGALLTWSAGVAHPGVK
jgi:hypothetical protein